MQLIKHIAECHERGNEDKLYCEECGVSFKTKKTLKHINKSYIKPKKGTTLKLMIQKIVKYMEIS